MPEQPPDVDFLVDGSGAGVDEDLPEPAAPPWWFRARVPIVVAAVVAVLAGLMFRLTAAGPGDHRPAAGPKTTRPSPVDRGPTLTFPHVKGDYIKMGPPQGRFPMAPCDVLPKCIVTFGVPHSVIAALKDHLPGMHMIFGSTSLERTGIAGRHHRFRAASLQAKRGKVAIRITIVHTGRSEPGHAQAGEQETAFGARIYARARVDGYFVSIDMTAPTGRIPAHAAELLALATDRRLRPGP